MALKLLIVDDEPDVASVIRSIVQALGYEAIVLTDSREAQTRVDREKFDGVFLDASMPFLDGFGLTQHIRQSNSNGSVPIVMLTAYGDAKTLRKGLDAGITFFLTKPVDAKKIEQVLRMMRYPMLKERRRYVRLPLRLLVACKSERYQFKSESMNISESGMLLEGSGGMGMGQEVMLTFSLGKSATPISVLAKVVRCQSPDSMGVYFEKMDSEALKQIQEYIARAVTG